MVIKRMADSFSAYLVRKQMAEADDAEVSGYGLEIILGWLAQVTVLLASGAALRLLPLLAVFLPAFCIKKVLGGYHAKSHASCITTFTCLALGACLLARLTSLPIQKALLPGILLLALFFIFSKAPVFHKHNPKTEQQRFKYRVIGRIWGTLQMLILLLLAVMLPESCMTYTFTGALGFALAAGTLLIKSP